MWGTMDTHAMPQARCVGSTNAHARPGLRSVHTSVTQQVLLPGHTAVVAYVT